MEAEAINNEEWACLDGGLSSQGTVEPRGSCGETSREYSQFSLHSSSGCVGWQNITAKLHFKTDKIIILQ
jgi:hypothetical protein